MLMKKIIVYFFVLSTVSAVAQDIYRTASTEISFHAGTPVEDIDAVNTKAISFMNIKTGEVTISIPIKEFQFKRSLMQEHFNENYLESEKYPRAEFKGHIDHIELVDWKLSSPMEVTVTGFLNVHGVSKERTLTVTISKKNSNIVGATKFNIALEDHNIDRPKILWEKIAENVDVTSNFVYEPYKK